MRSAERASYACARYVHSIDGCAVACVLPLADGGDIDAGVSRSDASAALGQPDAGAEHQGTDAQVAADAAVQAAGACTREALAAAVDT